MLVGHLIFYGFSVFAYGIASFSLSVWVYQTTNSIASFTAVGIAALLPAFLFTPIAGVVIDRISARKSLQYSLFAMAIGWLTIAAALYFDASVTVLYAPLIFMGTFMSLQAPAYNALIAELVDPAKYANANGIFGILSGVASVGSPFVAGLLVGVFDISLICLIPFFALLVQAMGLQRLPSGGHSKSPEESLVSSLIKLFHYIRYRKQLALLLVFSLLVNTSAETASIIVTPLSLDLYGADKTGVLMTIAGAGSFLGNVVLSMLPSLANKEIKLIFALNAIQGLLLIILSQSSMSFSVVVFAMLLFFIFEALYDGIDLSYWQKEAPDEMRASILSCKSMSSLLAMLLAYVLAAPIVDSISSLGSRISLGASEPTISFSSNPLITLLTLIGLTNFVIVALFSVVFMVVTWLPVHSSEPDELADRKLRL